MASAYEQLLRDQEALQEQNVDLKTTIAKQTADQQKATLLKAEKDANRSQYVNYLNQINPYGVQSEKVADAGLINSGYFGNLKSRQYSTLQNNLASTFASRIPGETDLATSLSNTLAGYEVERQTYKNNLALSLQQLTDALASLSASSSSSSSSGTAVDSTLTSSTPSISAKSTANSWASAKIASGTTGTSTPKTTTTTTTSKSALPAMTTPDGQMLLKQIVNVINNGNIADANKKKAINNLLTVQRASNTDKDRLRMYVTAAGY